MPKPHGNQKWLYAHFIRYNKKTKQIERHLKVYRYGYYYERYNPESGAKISFYDDGIQYLLQVKLIGIPVKTKTNLTRAILSFSKHLTPAQEIALKTELIELISNRV